MVCSLCYLVLRGVLQLVAMRGRSTDVKDLEIVVLRHELAILRRRSRVLAVFVDHYNGHRPHRALTLTPPRRVHSALTLTPARVKARVQRRGRLGGVIREYALAA